MDNDQDVHEAVMDLLGMMGIPVRTPAQAELRTLELLGALTPEELLQLCQETGMSIATATQLLVTLTGRDATVGYLKHVLAMVNDGAFATAEAIYDLAQHST